MALFPTCLFHRAPRSTVRQALIAVSVLLVPAPGGSVSAEMLSVLPLPARPHQALGGRAIAQSISGFVLAAREAVLRREILSGNVPGVLRKLVPVKIADRLHTAVFSGLPDFLAVGKEGDAFQTPLTPATAQAIADQLNCSLPTPQMVDAIFRAAALKLVPSPQPP